MTDAGLLEGRCLCGAVTIAARLSAPELVACHCDMCRRQSGGIHMSIMTDQAATKVTGNVSIYASSDWAERAFCPTCGSTLWYGTVHDGARYLSAGLFDRAGDARLTTECFSDNCPPGYALAGDHKKLSGDETLAFFMAEEEAVVHD